MPNLFSKRNATAMKFLSVSLPCLATAQMNIGNLYNGALLEVLPILTANDVSFTNKNIRQFCYGSGYHEINTPLTSNLSPNEFRTEQNFTCAIGDTDKRTIFNLAFSNVTNPTSCSTFPLTNTNPSNFDYYDYAQFGPSGRHSVMNLTTIVRTTYVGNATLFAGPVIAGLFTNGTAVRVDFDPSNRTQIVNACQSGTAVVNFPIPLSLFAIYN